MANKKISLLTELTSPASGDFVPIVDTSTSQTKRISYSNLVESSIIGASISGAILESSVVFDGDVQFDDEASFENQAIFNAEVTIGGSDFSVSSDTDTSINGAFTVTADAEFKEETHFEKGIFVEDGAVTKQECYNKDGAIRLQRGTTNSEEILLRYEGPNSEDFVIQQWHGGNKEGQIKFQGDTPDGSNTIRLDAKNVDVGFSNTVLTKIYSDTNFGSQKKFVFVDSRTEDHGLQFKHSGPNSPTFQFGMAGAAYNSADFGQLKVRHTTSLGVTEDVIVVDKDNGYTKLESDRTEMKNAKASGYVQVGTFNGSSNFPADAQAGAIIFNSSNGTFNGFDGSSWSELG